MSNSVVSARRLVTTALGVAAASGVSVLLPTWLQHYSDPSCGLGSLGAGILGLVGAAALLVGTVTVAAIVLRRAWVLAVLPAVVAAGALALGGRDLSCAEPYPVLAAVAMAVAGGLLTYVLGAVRRRADRAVRG